MQPFKTWVVILPSRDRFYATLRCFWFLKSICCTVTVTSGVTVATPTDRPKSVCNRCVIEVFGGILCVVTLFCGFFCGCKGFCHRTEFFLLLLLSLYGYFLWWVCFTVYWILTNDTCSHFRSQRFANYTHSVVCKSKQNGLFILGLLLYIVIVFSYVGCFISFIFVLFYNFVIKRWIIRKSCYDIGDICPVRARNINPQTLENVFILYFVWLVVIGFRQY